MKIKTLTDYKFSLLKMDDIVVDIKGEFIQIQSSLIIDSFVSYFHGINLTKNTESTLFLRYRKYYNWNLVTDISEEEMISIILGNRHTK